MTIKLQERAGMTLMTIRQVWFERREDRDGIEGGWPSMVDALERVVAERLKGVQRAIGSRVEA